MLRYSFLFSVLIIAQFASVELIPNLYNELFHFCTTLVPRDGLFLCYDGWLRVFENEKELIQEEENHIITLKYYSTVCQLILESPSYRTVFLQTHLTQKPRFSGKKQLHQDVPHRKISRCMKTLLFKKSLLFSENSFRSANKKIPTLAHLHFLDSFLRSIISETNQISFWNSVYSSVDPPAEHLLQDFTDTLIHHWILQQVSLDEDTRAYPTTPIHVFSFMEFVLAFALHSLEDLYKQLRAMTYLTMELKGVDAMWIPMLLHAIRENSDELEQFLFCLREVPSSIVEQSSQEVFFYDAYKSVKQNYIIPDCEPLLFSFFPLRVLDHITKAYEY